MSARLQIKESKNLSDKSLAELEKMILLEGEYKDLPKKSKTLVAQAVVDKTTDPALQGFRLQIYNGLITKYNKDPRNDTWTLAQVKQIIDDEIKSLTAKSAQQPAQQPAQQQQQQQQQVPKKKKISAIRTTLESFFPEINFSSAQINFIKKLLSKYRIFTLQEAVQGATPQEKIIISIINSIQAEQIFNGVKELYGEDDFSKRLYGALSSIVKQLPPSSQEKTAVTAEPTNTTPANKESPPSEEDTQPHIPASALDESLNEPLFKKFMNKTQDTSAKQLFRFNGETFKKYNRG
jgi:hypothetical protein